MMGFIAQRAESLRRLRSAQGDAGSAVVEFVFVAILVLVPLIYLIVTVAVIQRSRLAVTNAARDVGRALGSAPSSADAASRSQAALRIALANQGMKVGDVQLRYVAADADCDAAAQTPTLTAGSNFAVCVLRQQPLPAIPGVFSAAGVRTIGRYVVHIDDFAAVTP